MKSIPPRRRHRRGVALLAVLAVITLMVILLLSFLVTMTLDRQTTANYSQSIKAQEIGLGALEEITCDLKQEIAAASYEPSTPAGSSAVYSYTDPVTGQTVMAYIPASNKSARPARVGYPATDFGLDVDSTNNILLPPTLIRVSRDSTDPFYNLSGTTTPSAGSGTSDYPEYWTALPPARATTTWTTTPSYNGRSIPTTLWTKPMLLGTNSTPPSDFGTITTVSGVDVGPPQWVYVGRSGSINTYTDAAFQDGDLTSPSSNNLYADAAGANSNAILGRYAYVIYDEGALLDANVAGADGATAGSPPYSTTSTPLTPFRNKSYLAFADLTQIPGLNGSNGQSLLTTLVDSWRNQGGYQAFGSSSNSYANLILGTTSSSNIYTGAAALGFLTGFGPRNTGTAAAAPTPYTATQNDNPFLSRQDLIDYFTSVVQNTSPLPYLGTFSRAINAPSASPYTIHTYNYAKAAENTSTSSNTSIANRDMANVRFPATGTSQITMTHYKDDGTTTTNTFDPGSPLLQRRFSLAKIAWIGYNGPNSAAFNSNLTSAQQAAAIQDCFGLVWDTSNDPSNANLPYNTWDYVGGTHDGFSTTSPPNVINTLAQVAALATPREPNFFELIKAGILNGSVGRDPGPVTPNSTSAGVSGALFDSYSALPDAHLVQIGANIIDQATQDGYPTAIYFAQHNPSTYPAPYYRLFDTAFGIKDLPYLYRIFPQIYTTSLTGNTTFSNVIGTCQGWYQPELWNPHQNPSTGTTPTTRPSAFRVRAHGGAQFAWHQLSTLSIPASVGNDQGIASDPPATIDYESLTAGSANYSSANPSNTLVPSCVYFNDPNGNVFREQPLMLTTSNADVATTTANSPQNVWQSSWTAEYVNSSANQFVAIWVGSDPNYNPNVMTSGVDDISHVCEYKSTTTVPTGSPAYPTLALEYKDSSGNYHPYSLFSRFIEQLGSDSTPPNTTTHQDDTSTWCVANTGVPIHMDPRTDRFSGSSTGPDSFANIDPPSWNYQDTQTTLYYGPSSTIPGVANPPIPSGSAPYFFYINSGTLTSGTNPTKPDYLTTWIQNQTATQNAAQATNPGFISAAANDYSYYLDPDQMGSQGVTVDQPRPGDGFRWSDPTSSRGNGIMFFHTSTANPAGTGNDEAPQRPVILNRPFRSVGELGYAFRDVPFKSLDFWSQYSADAALLDLFSVQDEPAVVAGQFNPNDAPVPVLEAVLSGGALKEIDPTVNYTTTELKNVATAIATYVSPDTTLNPSYSGPLKNRQDLVTAGSGLYSNSPSTSTDLSDKIYTALTGASGNKYWGNKPYGEAPVRALSVVTNVRTWNLLIDIIAQSGHIIPNTTSSSTLGNSFVVDGEKRYWLHIAIDRYTGQVVDEQLEPVYE